MASLKDVALKAGVSPATVSRVINKSFLVEQKTKQKVIKAMEDLGYSPNIMAQNLSKKENFLIGVIIQDICNPYFAGILKALENEIYDLGYNIIFLHSDSNLFKEKNCIKSIMKMRPDGIIITPIEWNSENILKLKNIDIPVVTLTKIFEEFNGVAINHKEGGAQIARHFYDLGYDKIAYLGNNNDKFQGFQEELQFPNKKLYSYLEISLDKYDFKMAKFLVKEAIENYIKNNKELKFNAIFAENDILALELISVLKEFGKKVPEDIAVAGFDNSFFSEHFGITTVSQPINEISKLAVKILIDNIKNRNKVLERIELTPRLLPRNSTMILK